MLKCPLCRKSKNFSKGSLFTHLNVFHPLKYSTAEQLFKQAEAMGFTEAQVLQGEK
jgi:hypothetical protein